MSSSKHAAAPEVAAAAAAAAAAEAITRIETHAIAAHQTDNQQI